MAGLLRFLLRAVLVVMGLVVAASVMAAAAVLLLVWLLRAAWARLTGRPVVPRVMMRFGARAPWRQGYGWSGRAGAQGDVVNAADAADAVAARGALRRLGEPADVEDVQAKPPRDL